MRERESVDPTLINKKKKKKKNRYACKEKTVRERKRFLWFAQREGEREREEYKFWSVSHFGRDELLLSFSLFFLSFFLPPFTLTLLLSCLASKWNGSLLTYILTFLLLYYAISRV